MPSNAKGFVKVEIVLTLKDGSEITRNNLVFVE
jgi:hypothetical protein